MAESKSIYEKLAEMRVQLQAKKLIKNCQISFHPAIVLRHSSKKGGIYE